MLERVLERLLAQAIDGECRAIVFPDDAEALGGGVVELDSDAHHAGVRSGELVERDDQADAAERRRQATPDGPHALVPDRVDLGDGRAEQRLIVEVGRPLDEGHQPKRCAQERGLDVVMQIACRVRAHALFGRKLHRALCAHQLLLAAEALEDEAGDAVGDDHGDDDDQRREGGDCGHTRLHGRMPVGQQASHHHHQ